MWSQRNKVRPVWSKLPRPESEPTFHKSAQGWRGSEHQLSFAWPNTSFLLQPTALLLLLVSISCVSHVSSPSAQGSLSPCHVLQSTRPALSPLPPQLCPTYHGCFPLWSGVSFPNTGKHRPEGIAKVWWGAEPWGKGCAQVQPDLPPGQPSFNHPALHKDSKTWRAQRLLKKKGNEPGCFVPAHTAHREAGGREKAPHPTRSVAALTTLHGVSISLGDRNGLTPLSWGEFCPWNLIRLLLANAMFL